MLKIDPNEWKKHWCEIKHLVARREISLEITALIAREVCGIDDSASQKRMIRVLHDTNEDIEGTESLLKLLTEFTTSEATATIEISEEHYNHFLQGLGHMVCAEEHAEDHLKSAIVDLKREKNEEKKKAIAIKVNKLIEILDSIRLSRQECVNHFLSWGEEKVEAEEKA